jgi:hypothetical protein
MRKWVLGVCAAAALAAGATADEAEAAPANGLPIFQSQQVASPIQEARVFCYNRYTGRFLYWGYCRRPRPRFYSRPRVYCYNRYSGRFLHWGSCWR